MKFVIIKEDNRNISNKLLRLYLITVIAFTWFRCLASLHKLISLFDLFRNCSTLVGTSLTSFLLPLLQRRVATQKKRATLNNFLLYWTGGKDSAFPFQMYIPHFLVSVLGSHTLMQLPLLQLSENTEVQHHVTGNTKNTIFSTFITSKLNKIEQGDGEWDTFNKQLIHLHLATFRVACWGSFTLKWKGCKWFPPTDVTSQ